MAISLYGYLILIASIKALEVHFDCSIKNSNDSGFWPKQFQSGINGSPKRIAMFFYHQGDIENIDISSHLE